MCLVTKGGLGTKRRGLDTWSHNTPTANNSETKLSALPIQTHSHHMTTLLWLTETSVCVCVCCQWGGVVIWVSSREWNKRSEGDSLPSWDRQIILTQSVTIRGRQPKFLNRQDKGFSESLSNKLIKYTNYCYFLFTQDVFSMQLRNKWVNNQNSNIY